MIFYRDFICFYGEFVAESIPAMGDEGLAGLEGEIPRLNAQTDEPSGATVKL